MDKQMTLAEAEHFFDQMRSCLVDVGHGQGHLDVTVDLAAFAAALKALRCADSALCAIGNENPGDSPERVARAFAVAQEIASKGRQGVYR